ncbi:hypothetical protein [Rhodoligotrophos defluvii]|uniref:hypothetical protein n=1 Tax=Rhodoligotrophos defluvii TaxID=2561934 RepID=UPI0010C9F8C0|nr:hypothetical protein [Rhodoligotrophos defluvii]
MSRTQFERRLRSLERQLKPKSAFLAILVEEGETAEAALARHPGVTEASFVCLIQDWREDDEPSTRPDWNGPIGLTLN